MGVKDIMSKDLGIGEFTGPSLRKAVTHRYNKLSDDERTRINHKIAHEAIKAVRAAKGEKKYEGTGKPASLKDAGVLAVNHAGPLDVTVEWETKPDGTLSPTGFHVHSGGDQVNVSKVFSSFREKIALVALAGKKGKEITDEWEKNFLNPNIIPVFIRNAQKDQQVAVYNMIDGEALSGMFEWADEPSKETIERMNRETLAMLEAMLEERPGNAWMVFSAGGPIKYNGSLAYYASLVEAVKKQYAERVELLIDFKHVSGADEAMSVLDIHRKAPQDMIKPNLEEFIQILAWSGLAEKGSLDKNTITEEAIRSYAAKLRSKYNLLGVLVSMDKAGLMLVLEDRTIREKGIKIKPACHTAAGDSLKAGILYALSKGRSFEEAVHAGNLFGASTASMEGSQTVTPQKLAEIEALARMQNIKPDVGYFK